MAGQRLDLADAESSLREGGVVLCATDTVYGLAVRPGRPESVDEVYRLKGRSYGRPLPVMVGEPDDLADLGVHVNEAARRLLGSSLVPGALTLALGFAEGRPRPAWLDGRVEVAVRIPAASPMRDLVLSCGPLLVTSANYTDRPTPSVVPEILAMLDGEPDVVVDSGPCHEVPSTLVNCNLERPAVERVGVVPEDMIWELLGDG
jgi:L-threonylcarbamoyladenylate synthase